MLTNLDFNAGSNSKKILERLFSYINGIMCNLQFCDNTVFFLCFVMSPPEGLGDILFFPGRQSVRMSVCLSVCHESCPLCNLKTPEAIFTKLHTNIN